MVPLQHDTHGRLSMFRDSHVSATMTLFQHTHCADSRDVGSNPLEKVTSKDECREACLEDCVHEEEEDEEDEKAAEKQ